MKKKMLFLSLSLMGYCFALPSYVQFCTQGEQADVYADGTVVQDGEVYACVWIKKGHSFAGITADGELVDSVNNKLIGAAPLAKDGHCKPVVFMLNAGNADLGDGLYEVYLLDTRKSSSQGRAVTPAGVSGKSLAVVNGWRSVGASSAKSTDEPVAGQGIFTASIVPEKVPSPVIKSIRVHGGKVVLTVGKTVPYLRYGIASGATPGRLTKNFSVPGANGTGDGDLTLVIDQPEDNKFFKVVRE